MRVLRTLMGRVFLTGRVRVTVTAAFAGTVSETFRVTGTRRVSKRGVSSYRVFLTFFCATVLVVLPVKMVA